jgi:spore germination protein GerM
VTRIGRTARRSCGTVVLLAAVLLGGGGCGVPVQADPTPVPADQLPYGLASAGPSTTSAAPTTQPSAESPHVYFVGPQETLVARQRAVSGDTLTRRLTALLASLQAGPSQAELALQLGSALGPGITLKVTGVVDGTATVDIAGTGDLPAGRGSRLASGEIVLTATSMDGVNSVVLTRNELPVEALLPNGELTDAPLTAGDYAILLVAPAPAS